MYTSQQNDTSKVNGKKGSQQASNINDYKNYIMKLAFEILISIVFILFPMIIIIKRSLVIDIEEADNKTIIKDIINENSSYDNDIDIISLAGGFGDSNESLSMIADILLIIGPVVFIFYFFGRADSILLKSKDNKLKFIIMRDSVFYTLLYLLCTFIIFCIIELYFSSLEFKSKSLWSLDLKIWLIFSCCLLVICAVSYCLLMYYERLMFMGAREGTIEIGTISAFGVKVKVYLIDIFMLLFAQYILSYVISNGIGMYENIAVSNMFYLIGSYDYSFYIMIVCFVLFVVLFAIRIRYIITNSKIDIHTYTRLGFRDREFSLFWLFLAIFSSFVSISLKFYSDGVRDIYGISMIYVIIISLILFALFFALYILYDFLNVRGYIQSRIRHLINI